MRAVVQRVNRASVSVDGEIIAKIGAGVCVFIGVGVNDTKGDAEWIAAKIVDLRIFEDAEGRMNRALLEIGGEALIVSQFTLYGDCRKGKRPGFTDAAPPDKGNELYEETVKIVTSKGVNVQTGRFQAHMKVDIENDGPVTMLLDSGKLF